MALCCCAKFSICLESSLWMCSGSTPTLENNDLGKVAISLSSVPSYMDTVGWNSTTLLYGLGCVKFHNCSSRIPCQGLPKSRALRFAHFQQLRVGVSSVINNMISGKKCAKWRALHIRQEYAMQSMIKQNAFWMMAYCNLDLRTPSSSCSSSTFFCIRSFSLARILTRSSVSFVRTLNLSMIFI